VTTWFSDAVKSYEDDGTDDQPVDLEQQRDEFRESFETAIDRVVLPKFEDVKHSALKHGFPATVVDEKDSQQRLRAVNFTMLARPDVELSDSMFGHSVYKIAVQMRSLRVGQMIYVDNVPQIVGHNYFGGLESLMPATIDQHLQEFVEFALRHREAVIR